MFSSKPKPKPRLTNAYIKNKLDMAFERGAPTQNVTQSNYKNKSLEMVMRHVIYTKGMSRNKIMNWIKKYNYGFEDEQALKFQLFKEH